MEMNPSDQSEGVARPAPLQLPPGIKLCLADVDTGSNTRTLVGKVSDWCKSQPAWAEQLYKVISASNQSVADGLLSLHVAHANDPEAYARTLQKLAAMPSSAWDVDVQNDPSPVTEAFIHVRNAMRSVRAGMRELGARSGAPVEPPEMTRLVDATVSQAHGILGGGVPGAGGYDAMFVLFLAPSSLTSKAACSAPNDVCQIWKEYTELSVGPLLCGADEAKSEIQTAGKKSLAQLAAAFAQTRPGLQVHRPAEVPGLTAWVSP